MAYRKIIKKALASQRKLIPEQDAYEICAAFEISYPPTRLVKTWSAVSKAGKELGFPLVLKIVSPGIIHKSDVGGVVVGISNRQDLKQAYEKIMADVKEKAGDVPIDGILVQKSMPKGVEVAVGGLKNELFGPMVMFGSGGVLIEVFKDVSFRLAPLDKGEAMRQIQDTKAYEILKGVRGARPSDLDALTKLIVNASRLIAEVPEIMELDFNPVLVYPDGCAVVDARMILEKK